MHLTRSSAGVNTARKATVPRTAPIALALLIPLALAACGGGDGQTVTELPPAAGVVLSGSVGDGPVVSARIGVADANGQPIAAAQSDSAANYTVRIPANAPFPLVLEATGGTDLVTGREPDFALRAIAESGTRSTVHLNPFGTIIAETAAHGALSSAALAQATARVLEQLNFGLHPELNDPVGAELTAANIPNLVLASEVLGETLRRTAGHLSPFTVTADEAVRAIGADLTDGRLDGAGGDASAHVAAVFSVASAQVLLEALAGELYVDGRPAAAAIESAIRTVRPGSVPGASLHWNAQLRNQLTRALAAARAVHPDVALDGVASTIGAAGADAMPEALSAGLSPAAATALAQALNVLAAGDSSVWQAALAAADPSTPVPPSEPLTIGQPDRSTYELARLDYGTPMFIDRDYLFTDLPHKYLGMDMILTAKDDRTSTGDAFLSFEVNVPVVVYVAHDDAITDKPSWLSDWTDTGDDLVGRSIYAKSFAPGTVVLGGNTSDGADSGSMYMVMVAPDSGCSACATTPSLLTLDWEPNPGLVSGYLVYAGPDAATVSDLIADVSENLPGFDLANPTLNIDPAADLGIHTLAGSRACFAVKAYNVYGTSGLSEPVCIVM